MLKKLSLFIFFLANVITSYSQEDILVFPNNNYWISGDTTAFLWDKDATAVSYELFISTTNTFSDTVYFSALLSSNLDTVFNLPKGTFFWKIRVNLMGGVFYWSNIFTFNVFTPASISNLGLWLKPNEGLSYSANKVVGWSDQSGKSNHANQIDTNLSPMLSNVNLNGYNPLQFDGVNDYLLLDDSLANPFNLFFLIDIDSVGVAKSLFSDIIHNDGLIYYFYPEKIALWKGGQRVYSPFKSGSNFYNMSHQTTGLDFYKNSVQMSLSSTGTIYDIKIKRIGASTFKPFGGKIYEIIGFNGNITTAQTDSVNNYLRYKYAPPVNLGANIYATNYCDTVLYAGKRFTNYTWQDGSVADTLVVNKTGWYSVTVTDIFGFTSTDSVYVQFPEINQILSDTICQGDLKMWTTNLDTTNFNFEWSNGVTDSLINISLEDDYWVKVTDTLGCFQYSDTITISVDSFPTQATLGIDKTVCQYSNLGLEVGVNVDEYLWSTNDTAIQTIVDTAGVYWVEVKNNKGCIARDTINITINGIAPTVNFDATNLCDNIITTFSNTSFTTDGSNLIAWHWDFGNGDTSNIENTQNNFAAGNYNVVLEVETDSGCTNKLQQQITIHEKPTAGFFPSNSLMCSNQNSSFVNNSFSSDGIINMWYWDFGEISIVTDTSSLENSIYSFSNAGSFNVQLISTTEYGCNDTVSQFVSVKQTPSASFIIQDSCASSPIGFVNTSSGSLFSTFWDFGDFNSSSLANPTHTYSVAGVYNAELIIKDLNGCWDTVLSPITINENPEANFISSDYCVLNSSQFYDSSITASGVLHLWDWEVLNTSYNSSNQHPQFIFSQSDTGVYNLKLKVANSFGCSDSVTKTIVVHPLPIPNFTFTPEIGLPPLMVSFNNTTTGGSNYLWQFGDGNSLTNLNPTYTYTDSNTFEIKLIATSLYGCVDSISKSIQVIEPIVDVAVKNIIYELLPNSDLMKITVQLANKGVIAIQNLDLMLYNSSTGKVLEKWEGNIMPGNQELVELTSIIEVPRGELPDVICIEALNPNNSVDINMSDNELCKSLIKFELISIYPIPSNNELNLDFIVPESNETEITLYNNIGKKVAVLYKGIVTKGLNRKKFFLGVYSNGVYVIEIKFKGETIRKKIMVN